MKKAVFRLRVLGAFELRRPARRPAPMTRKTRALLAYLALHPGRAHGRDMLAALLWSRSPTAQARTSLRQALTAIRRALATPRAPGIVTTADGIALAPSAFEIDVRAFERLASRDPERAAGLYRGPLLDGLDFGDEPYDEWVGRERERLRDVAVTVMARILETRIAAGALDAATDCARRLLALDPLHEPAYRALMDIHARLGRRSEALRVYERCVETLRREGGGTPEPATRRLYSAILGQRRHAGDAEAASLASIPAELAAPEHALAGRAEALAVLQAALASARSGHGRAVLLVGEAGIGKTRLAAEIMQAAAREGRRTLAGGCHETEQTLPFAPWVHALRPMVTAGQLDGFEPVWSRELARLFPELEPAEVAPARGRPDVLRVFEAVARLVERVGATAALLIVLDDLHWADAMSLRLFAFLARRLRERPVLLLGTVRAEDVAGSPLLAQVVSEVGETGQRLDVDPLSRADTLRLVESLASARLGEAIWRASEGNPFMIVETVRALGDRGSAPRDDGGSLPLVERVRALVSRRLGRLPPRARALAGAASVAGRRFALETLRAVAAVDDDTLATALDELVSRRVIRLTGEQGEFTHEQICAVAYAALLPARRRLLHRRAAEALEGAHAGRIEEVADALAHHYARAADSDKAVHYLVAVARQATRRLAHDDAIHALRDALARVTARPGGAGEDARTLDIVQRLTRSLWFAGRFTEARALLEEQQAVVARTAIPVAAGLYHLALATSHLYLGDSTATAAAARRAVEAAEGAGDASTAGKATSILAVARYRARAFRESLALATAAITPLERAGERSWLGQAWCAVGIAHTSLAEFDRAAAAFARAGVIGDETGDPRVRAPVAYGQGIVHVQRGEMAAGITACERAVELAADPFSAINALTWLGYAHVESGAPARAIEPFETALRPLPDVPRTQEQWMAAALLAEAWLALGELARAEASARDALAFACDAKDPDVRGRVLYTLGRLAFLQGDHDRARETLGQAFEAFTAIELGLQDGRVAERLAEACHAGGDAGAARHWLGRAEALFTGLGLGYHLARLDALRARLDPR